MTARPERSPVSSPARLRLITGRGRTGSRVFPWLVYAALVVGAFLTFVFTSTALDEATFEVRRLERQVEVELERQRQLHLQRIRLQSPEEVGPVVESMVGMVLPDEVITVSVVRPKGPDPSPTAYSVGGRRQVGSEPSPFTGRVDSGA